MSQKTVEVGISFLPDTSREKSLRKAEVLSHGSFDVISAYEDLGYPSPVLQLIPFAERNPDARIGPACLVVPKYKTMETIVSQMVMLESVSPGKTFLGLAPGAWMRDVGLSSASVQQMQHALESYMYLLNRRVDGFSSQYFPVEPGFQVHYETPPDQPIMVGAWGPRMLEMVGSIDSVQEIKGGGSANPQMVRLIRERLQSSRDIGIVLGAVTVVDKDARKAMHHAKRKAAMYIDVIGDKDPFAMAEYGAVIVRVKELMQENKIFEATKIIPDSLARLFVFAGTPEQVVEQALSIYKAGAKRVEFGSPHGIDEFEGVRLLTEEVLPMIQKELSLR